MKIDFFVHPEHANKAWYPYRKEYQQYIEHLSRILKESACPILVNGIEKGEFDKRFPLERIIESASHHILDCSIDLGEVRPSEWRKFTNLVNQGSEYRVHGCFFGQCTEGFAVQLFGYVQRKEHWGDWLPMDDKEKDKKERKIINYHKRKGDFVRSKIKYGAVLDPRRSVVICKPFPILIPFGNITYQLIDKETTIY